VPAAAVVQNSRYKTLSSNGPGGPPDIIIFTIGAVRRLAGQMLDFQAGIDKMGGMLHCTIARQHRGGRLLRPA
jgi:hypothetical protein